MKTLRLLTASLFFAAIFAVSAFAQVPVSSKIGVIDTRAFDSDKAGSGITKYVNGMNTLQAEFTPVDAEIKTLVTKYQSLGTEIQTLQKATPPNTALIQSKADEYGKMERDIKFKQEDAKARYQSRYGIVMGPIMQDIGKALQDYAKQKGYSLLLDAAKLDEAQLILAFDQTADATKDFITFYNARPAGTAVAPK